MRESVRRAQVKKRESAEKRVNRGHGQRVVPKELRFRTHWRRRRGKKKKVARARKKAVRKKAVRKKAVRKSGLEMRESVRRAQVKKE